MALAEAAVFPIRRAGPRRLRRQPELPWLPPSVVPHGRRGCCRRRSARPRTGAARRPRPAAAAASRCPPAPSTPRSDPPARAGRRSRRPPAAARWGQHHELAWKVPEQRNLAATLSPSATRSTISSRQWGKAARKLLNACRAGSASSGANRSSTSSSLPPLMASSTSRRTSALFSSDTLPSSCPPAPLVGHHLRELRFRQAVEASAPGRGHPHGPLERRKLTLWPGGPRAPAPPRRREPRCLRCRSTPDRVAPVAGGAGSTPCWSGRPRWPCCRMIRRKSGSARLR